MNAKRRIPVPVRLRCIHVIFAGMALMIAASSPDAAYAKVAGKVTVGGQPAANELVSLIDCKTNAVKAGPTRTGQDGSIEFPSADAGAYCIRAEIPSGYARQEITLTADPQQKIDLKEIIPSLSLVDRTLPAGICIFTFLMVIYPIGRYLAKPWAFRRDYLIGQLSGTSMKLYYKRFRAGALIKGKAVGDSALSDEDYTKAFEADFDKWYGRRYYIFPVLGLAVLSGICGWWGCSLLWDWAAGLRSSDSMRGLVGAALAGAFVWIISDEIDRLRRRDFTSYDVYYYIFRILLSVPFGWALTRVEVTLQVGIPTAFFLGAFPTSTLFKIARRLANARLQPGEDGVPGKLELESLQCVGKDAAERFRDEAISTIAQLAYADPLDLMIRTNFDFNYVVDCVSQALMWIYLEDKGRALPPYSLRGAQEVKYFYELLTSPAPDANAVAALTEIAAKLGMGASTLQCTLEQISLDPYTTFLWEIWH